MKKIISLVVLLAAVTMTAQAQGVKFGVKGGLNITKMSVSKDVADPDNQTGFYVLPGRSRRRSAFRRTASKLR